MHVCEEFRERITEKILDHYEVDKNTELQRELLVCNSCSDFYIESREVIDAISSVHFDIEEDRWDAMANQMRARILQDHAARQQSSWKSWFGFSEWRFRGFLPAAAGALALLLVSAGIYRLVTPLVDQQNGAVTATVTEDFSVDGINASLDPVTLEFLEQSELLLRSVMKLQSTSVDDLAEARQTAGLQLIALDQRKEAASDMPPVVNVMNKYETILRDIRNLNQRTIADDISDIQNRIEKNDLIANLKAFQPKLTSVETDLGIDQ